MSMSLSKQVTDREKSSKVVQATRGQLETVADALVERLAPAAGAETTALRKSVTVLGGSLLGWLSAQTDAMLAADAAHAAELGDDAALRAGRDAHAATVSQHLGALREVVRVYFGEASVAKLGLPGALPDDPSALHRLGGAVLAQLRDFTPPAPKLPSMKFVHAEWRALLEAPVAALGEALDAVALDRRENELTLTEKHRAIAAYDAAFRGTATALAGLFTAAGRDDLAARVRPSTRRAGQTAESTEGELPAAPEPKPAQE